LQLVQRVVITMMIAVIPVTAACGADAPMSEPVNQPKEDVGAAPEELVGSYSMSSRGGSTRSRQAWTSTLAGSPLPSI
jgi:hypothetical protein